MRVIIDQCGRRKKIAVPTANEIHTLGWYRNSLFMTFWRRTHGNRELRSLNVIAGRRAFCNVSTARPSSVGAVMDVRSSRQLGIASRTRAELWVQEWQ